MILNPKPSAVHLSIVTEYGRTESSRRLQIGDEENGPRVVEFNFRPDPGEVFAVELCDEWFGCILGLAEVEAIAAWWASVAADMKNNPVTPPEQNGHQ